LGRFGITVNCIHPGITRTERTAGLLEARARAQGTTVEAVERSLASGNSIRRLVDAADVANVVAFLASPRSIAINGDAIAAGGGAPRSIHY
jgi:NAD(P)-dependent dehydrogenase (short-subunit alcohol dehydrogenase family)